MSIFKNLLGNIFKPETLVDPVTFDDPLALKTGWDPINVGEGASFRNRIGVQANANRIEFRKSKAVTVLATVFMIIPFIAALAYYLFVYRPLGVLSSPTDFFQPIFFIVLTFWPFGLGIFYFYRKVVIFDKNYGYFWRGPRDKQGVIINAADQKDSVKLSEIHALQIIHEWIVKSTGKGGTTRYKSYELNLVLESGERKNVIDHGNKKKLLEDAKMLGQFLNVPVGDRTG